VFKIEVAHGDTREVVVDDKPEDNEDRGMIQEYIILEDAKVLEAITERVEATADMGSEEKTAILTILHEFSPLFSGRMGRATTVQHTIDTGDAKPTRTSMYRYTPSAWEEMREPPTAPGPLQWFSYPRRMERGGSPSTTASLT
jgi:hypothetical protein